MGKTIHFFAGMKVHVCHFDIQKHNRQIPVEVQQQEELPKYFVLIFIRNKEKRTDLLCDIYPSVWQRMLDNLLRDKEET